MFVTMSIPCKDMRDINRRNKETKVQYLTIYSPKNIYSNRAPV